MPNQDLLDLADRFNQLDFSIFRREATFAHPDIPHVRVTVRVWWDHARRDRDPYRFELSHYAHTPIQAGAYTPSAPFAADEHTALAHGIAAITEWIERAKREGHKPEANWLRPAQPG